MGNNTCQSCEHFRQHYIKLEDGYYLSAFGHCVYPLIKVRKQNHPACEKFSPRESDT